MNAIEKNQYYHNILAILSKDEYSLQQKAQEIVIYLESIFEDKKMQEEENDIYSSTKFTGSFRRTT